MRPLLLLLAAAPALALAQVYKCPGPGGKTVYSDAPCAQGQELAIPSGPAPARPAKGDADPAAAMRIEVIQAMLARGALAEARLYARTQAEFTLVDRAAAQQAREAREMRRARDDATYREEHRKIIEDMKRKRN